MTTKEYRAWQAMRIRCKGHSRAKDKKNYTDRGITVCSEWINSFPTFLRDMGKAPTLKHSLDRKDNDKGYSKDNCRWATATEQANNKSTNKEYYVSKAGGSWIIRTNVGGAVLHVASYPTKEAAEQAIVRLQVKIS